MQEDNSQVYKQTMKLMGNRFEISVVSQDAIRANECISAAVDEIKRIEQLLSTFRSDSDTNRVNAQAGIAPVKVSEELIAIIKRAHNISKITQGAFDITYGSIDKRFWNFDQQMTELPDASMAKEMVRLVNYQNIIIDDNTTTVFLKESGMRIGFGGIGKGYAADKAKQLLQKMGVESGIVNASGDLTAWGLQPNGQEWTIGIAHPDVAELPFSRLNVSNMAIATSGNYEKYVMINGQKYSHTINPRTGYPIKGIKSVTIICAHAELADALATPVTIMGVSAGLYLINQMHGVECIIIDDNNKIFTSNNIHLS
jgi:thiamine biosynthesis lipoprotein